MKSLPGIFLFFALTAFGQEYPDYGFTNKAEAKNQMVNGLKEGKWIEYMYGKEILNDTTWPIYRLVTYKAGKPHGIVREYSKFAGEFTSETPYINGLANGVRKEYYHHHKLFSETPYTDGEKNGIKKEYYDNGKLSAEIPYKEDKKNGVEHRYYFNGKPESDIPYTNDKKDGVEKEYFENGGLKQETIYKNDKAQAQKHYDENGNEIK